MNNNKLILLILINLLNYLQLFVILTIYDQILTLNEINETKL